MTNDFWEKQIFDIKGKTYIISIPIEEFNDLKQLIEIAKTAERNGLGVNIHYKTSNFYQGVLCQLYDKNTCIFKDFL